MIMMMMVMMMVRVMMMMVVMVMMRHFLESLVASLFLKIPRGVVWCDRELGIGLDLNDQS